jgi:hypothetical protein
MVMRIYKNESGKSAVKAYDYGEDWIRIQFENGKIYTYTDDSSSVLKIEQMKKLADLGLGLYTFLVKFTP